MMKDNIYPLVSICIPTFNGEKYIEEALKSAINQTYKNLEIIVSDDASKDDTIKLINKYKDLTQIPFRIHNHTPQGIGANWNNCIRKANGVYIKFLFQDDILEENCIEEMLKIFQENQNIGLVASKRTFLIEENAKGENTNNWVSKYGNLQQFIDDKNGELLFLNKLLFKSDEFRKSPLNKIGEPSVVMFKKEIVNKIGFFRTDLKQLLDYEFWYRILKVKEIIIINKPLVKFRIHSEQATNVNRNCEINDYEIYSRILYKNYYSYLNDKEQKKLCKRYSFFCKFLSKLKNITRTGSI